MGPSRSGSYRGSEEGPADDPRPAGGWAAPRPPSSLESSSSGRAGATSRAAYSSSLSSLRLSSSSSSCSAASRRRKNSLSNSLSGKPAGPARGGCGRSCCSALRARWRDRRVLGCRPALGGLISEKQGRARPRDATAGPARAVRDDAFNPRIQQARVMPSVGYVKLCTRSYQATRRVFHFARRSDREFALMPKDKDSSLRTDLTSTQPQPQFNSLSPCLYRCHAGNKTKGGPTICLGSRDAGEAEG